MYEQILAYVNRHIQLHPQEVQIFVSLLQEAEYKKGEFLLRAGEHCNRQFFIRSGCVKTFYMDSDGIEHIIQFGIENWWAADLNSFFRHTPADYYIEALENTRVFTLDTETIEQLYQDIPKFERLFRIISQNAYVAAQKRIVASFSKSAEDRFTDFLKKYPGLDQRIPQYMIASYIGVTPEFFSKMKKEYYRKA